MTNVASASPQSIFPDLLNKYDDSKPAGKLYREMRMSCINFKLIDFIFLERLGIDSILLSC